MSTATLDPRVHTPRNYLNADTVGSPGCFTLDHKRIALLYLGFDHVFSSSSADRLLS